MDGTYDVLKQQLDDLKSLLTEKDQRYTERFLSQEKAVTVSIATLDRRFDSINEFRQTLSDQSAHFATREEVSTKTDGLSKELSTIMSRVDRIEAKTGGAGILASGIAVGLSLLVAFAALVVPLIK